MTKEKFEAFVEVQMSGRTNMFDVRTVCMLSGGVLTREDCMDIMKGDNYSKYKEEYGV